jgi:hypothetical protein
MSVSDFKNKKTIFEYDLEIFNFSELFLNHLSVLVDVCSLQDLHLNLPSELLPHESITENNDQSLEIYKTLYSIDKGFDLHINQEFGVFLNKYKKFVNYLSSTIFKETLIYQRRPTLRVHFPESKAVGVFHRDRDYNHPIEEINIWVPITSAINTNSIWIESKFGKEDYSPINLNDGQAVIFDSGLKHGNKINTENLTRLSFNFRVIPESKWENAKTKKPKSSISQSLKLELNDYYDVTS